MNNLKERNVKNIQGTRTWTMVFLERGAKSRGFDWTFARLLSLSSCTLWLLFMIEPCPFQGRQKNLPLTIYGIACISAEAKSFSSLSCDTTLV